MSDQNHRALLSMKESLHAKAQQDQLHLLTTLRGQCGDKFVYTKGKVHKEAILVEVKKREVRLKRDPEAQDSFSVGLKDFTDYWKRA